MASVELSPRLPARPAPAPGSDGQRASEAGLRIHTYGPLDMDLERRAVQWFTCGPGHCDLVIKPERVWRHGAYAIKLFPAELLVRLRLRRSRARRSAESHRELMPLATPKPWIVLEDGSGRSLLVAEFVPGRFLNELWNEDGPGVAAFPHFMAEMHRCRILHGDFHIFNALWDGEKWLLLDLDGLRSGLHATRRKSMILRHWGRIHFALRGARGLRESFATYLKATNLAWDLERAWPKVVACSAKWARKRGVDPGYTARDGLNPAP